MVWCGSPARSFHSLTLHIYGLLFRSLQSWSLFHFFIFPENPFGNYIGGVHVNTTLDQNHRRDCNTLKWRKTSQLYNACVARQNYKSDQNQRHTARLWLMFFVKERKSRDLRSLGILWGSNVIWRGIPFTNGEVERGVFYRFVQATNCDNFYEIVKDTQFAFCGLGAPSLRSFLGVWCRK